VGGYLNPFAEMEGVALPAAFEARSAARGHPEASELARALRAADPQLLETD